ncbi:hypothetical protein IQ06DRAFT_259363 [Phaeosphaeriaceae sp. SRC1lsM3a]|nr:hypothetical protein IQ06DRAFT_259363 [Stagonospora sp. SRC1lsM3a]
MFSTKAVTLRALTRAPCQTRCKVRCPTAKRMYATEHEQRTQETLKTSLRLTWLTTTAAIGAAALYYTSQSSATPLSDKPKHRHDPGAEDPKPVEDRHGNSVEKHSIAAHKNQTKVREGKFSGKEFDNHVQSHSPGNPGGDFEKK